jgi:hypothetical protein
MTLSTSWWHNATDEQKLAQVKGGLECGMTSSHVGMNCGISCQTVRNFAKTFGINFPNTTVSSRSASRQSGKIRAAKIYGERHELTPYHFNIFGLGDAYPAQPEVQELSF